MSGLEIVGLVLGAVPIILSILETSKSLNRKKIAFQKKQFYIDRMINALSWQKTLIEGDLEILFRSIGLEDQDLRTIGSNPYEALLKQPDIQEGVQVLMGPRYDSYVQVLSDCERALLAILRSVKGLQGGAWVDNGKLADMMQANSPLKQGDRAFLKRLKFSMHKEELESTIRDLDRTSQLLTRLRETSQEANQVILQIPSMKTSKMIALFQQVRKRAYSLYGAMMRSWAKPCHETHIARLYLDNRMDYLGDGMNRKGTGRNPAIEFTVTLEGRGSQGQSTRHTCSIETMGAEDGDGDVENSGKTLVVSFAIPSSSAVKSPVTKNIDDICHLIVESAIQSQALKIYLRHDGVLCYRCAPGGGMQTITTPTTINDELISLQEILHLPKARLSLRQRVRLSAVVASSAMQLHATPWCAALRKECFSFLEHNDSGRTWVDLDHPFVTCLFKNPGQTTRKSGEAELLDLGILIIELWENESIEAFAAQMHLQLLDTYDCRQSIARCWLKEKRDDMLPPVFGAARRCVECRFDTLSVDWDDRKVNLSIFEGVVKPLWESCRE
ncbi:hypothetical protein A1O3_04721 [Capronia epimyces CBS 606.96]|uniref:DUF7580 domain-containing protein n=1 Tax=Capronia epimyces CBS 606.96 TaxID=1182542 RepID=W9YP62_9EURO|nr:uncharacterized protein A1O3_04721 [Capronia epimyces CBS 606.96]EXJ84054.1 hypothetical protein A1O3_04721 [Capronia epimyces CBS 606.96]